MSDSFTNARANQTVTVLSREPERLVLRAEYARAGEPPPPHLHPEQDERFEVLAGTLRVRLDGDERDLAAGEVLEIPRGTVHQMWNPGPEAAEVRWETAPALATEEFLRGVAEAMSAEPLDGERLGRLLEEHRREVRFDLP